MEKKDMTAVIARCLNGDALAQEELVLAVQDRVYYHCRKMLKDEDRAFDLTQDTLMAMLTKLDTLQNPEAFWSWLGGITANLCRNAINRGPREVQIPEDEEGNSLLDTYETLDEQTVPDKALDNDETRRMIAELVDDLPDAQRQCVLLYYYDEMSVKDIAASLEVSENTIKSRLNYARKSIKEGVERYEKQGIKLYSLSPLPFLLFFLGQDAKACSMTAEQAAQLTQQVMQNASAVAAGAGTVATVANAAAGSSAASAAGGSVAATAAKSAAAAAGKGLLGGLSTKVIVGAVAGLVLAGGITGGVLLGGDKDAGKTSADTEQVPVSTEHVSTDTDQVSQGGRWTPMKYVALPEWVDMPYDAVVDYFLNDYLLGSFTAGGCRYLQYWANPDDSQYSVLLTALPDSDHIRSATFYFDSSAELSLGWQNITAGDSFQSVLKKLGIGDISPGANWIQGYSYEDAHEESEYIVFTDENLSDAEKWIDLYYIKKGQEQESGTRIWFSFSNDKLRQVHYEPPTDGHQSQTEAEEPAEIVPDAESEQEPTTEISPSMDDLSQDDILVEFESELVEVSEPFRMYSMMWTWTKDSYYAIAPDAVFTVTNNGTNENAYLIISMGEWLRSAESFISVVNHDGEYKELDMMGEYWSDEVSLKLSDHPAELSARENLYWSDEEWGSNGERPYFLKLLPGESVTFHMPEREQDAIYNLNVRYSNDAEELGLPGRSFLVTSDDVRAPSTTITP